MKVKDLNTSLETVQSTVTYHHYISDIESESTSYTWEQPDVISFDELIVSWNVMRPQYGEFHVSISVKIGEMWSPWFLYATWGSESQKGGDIKATRFPLEIQQDIVKMVDGQKATGFRIRIQAVSGAILDEFYSIHVCASSITDVYPEKNFNANYSIDLKIPLISQMILTHPRHRDMCSAASTSAVISYLLNKNRIDPVFFALKARDEAFDIFGNWVLNTAHASAVLGKKWHCWVQRLTGFEDIYTRLRASIPVVVSVKGPLPGSALPYNQGHLLVVKGYHHKEKKVLCMDPAFGDDESTNVSYDLKDFLEAWSRRQCIAYLFEKTDQNFSDTHFNKSLSSQ